MTAEQRLRLQKINETNWPTPLLLTDSTSALEACRRLIELGDLPAEDADEPVIVE